METVSYKTQTLLEIYDTSLITSEAVVNTFARTQIMSLPSVSVISPATDEQGNSIARPALLYASNPEDTSRFRVTSPDGTCVIGSSENCLVQESTLTHRGSLDSVLIDGQIYRVRYSGADSTLERFAITSFDPIVGEWSVELESQDDIIQYASAAEEMSLKVKYRAERSPLVTVRSE